MRRAIVFVLTLAMLAAGAAAVDAKPRRKSPRLHAFRSCTNLLGYAQRNGLRVIRNSPVAVPVAPMPETGAGGGDDRTGGGPVAAPAPAAGGGEGTSQTNVQEAGVDEPDWVKAKGTTLYVAKDGKLRAIDASGARPRELGAIEVPGFSQDLLVHGDRALVIAAIGYGPVAVAGQVAPVSPARWLGRTRLLEVDISDPARMRVLRELDVEGSYLNARLTGATARVIVRTEPRGLVMPGSAPAAPTSETRRVWRDSVRRTRTRALWPAGAAKGCVEQTLETQ